MSSVQAVPARAPVRGCVLVELGVKTVDPENLLALPAQRDAVERPPEVVPREVSDQPLIAVHPLAPAGVQSQPAAPERAELHVPLVEIEVFLIGEGGIGRGADVRLLPRHPRILRLNEDPDLVLFFERHAEAHAQQPLALVVVEVAVQIVVITSLAAQAHLAREVDLPARRLLYLLGRGIRGKQEGE